MKENETMRKITRGARRGGWLLPVLAGLAVLWAAEGRGWAAGFTNAGTGDWTDMTMWGGFLYPSTGDTFSIGTGTVTVGNGDTITVGTGTVSGSALTVGMGGSLTSDGITLGGGATLTVQVGGTLSAPLTVSGADSLILGSAVTLGLGSPISLGSGSALTANVAGGTATLSGAVTGSGQLVKTGIGILAVNGSSNNYAGGTDLQAGTILVEGNNVLGVGTIKFDGAGTVVKFGGSYVLGNAIQLNSAGIINDNGWNVTLLGNISDGTSGAANLTISGGGTTTLSGANTYTGTTTISSNLLLDSAGALGGGGNITFIGGGDLRYSGVNTIDYSARIKNSAEAAIDTNGQSIVFASAIDSSNGDFHLLDSAGGGNLTFTAVNAYTGDTVLEGGTLSLSGAGSIAASSSLVITSGTTFDISGVTAAAQVRNLSDGGLSGGQIALGSKTLDIVETADTTFGGQIGGTGGLTLDSASTSKLTLSSAAAYTGTTKIAGGVLVLGYNGTTLGGGGPITFAGGSLQFLVDQSDYSSQIKNSTGAIAIDPAGNSISFNSAIDGSNTGGLVVNDTVGGGGLVLNATNQYTGATTITAGTLVLDTVNDAILSSSSVSVGATGALALNTDQKVRNLSVASGGAVDLGGKTLTVVESGNTTVAGAGALNNGSGTFSMGNLTLDTASTGTLTLADANTLGVTNLNGGTLEVDGALTSATAFNVNGSAGVGGTLRGTGTITGDVLVNGGTLAAGTASSTGILTINGNLTLTPDSVVSLRLNGTTAGTGYDQIVIGSGYTASLDGKLSLTVGSIHAGDTFTLVKGTDANSVSGAFSSVTNSLGNALQYTLANNPAAGGGEVFTVTAIQTSFVPFAGNRNQAAVAGALDGLSSSSALVAALNNLPGTSLPTALQLLSPVQQTTVAQTAISAGQAGFQTLQNRLGDVRAGSTGLSLDQFGLLGSNIPPASLLAGLDLPAGVKAFAPRPGNPWGFFVAADGNVGDTEGRTVQTTYHGYGFTAGGDYRLDKALAAGFALGYGHAKTDFDNSGSNGTADTVRFGPYATWQDKAGDWVDGTLGGACHWFGSNREGFGGMATGSTAGTELDGSLQYGHDFKAGAWTLTPSLGFNYLHLIVDGYTEAGSLAPLAIQEQTTDSFRSVLEQKFAYAFHWAGIGWAPYVRGGWSHEYLDAAQSVTARFASGAGNSFLTEGDSLGHDSATFGAGLQAALSETFSANLGYSGEANDRYQDHSFNAALRVQF